jgi:hypothetical protein
MGVEELVRASISAARSRAESSWPWKEMVLAGVIIPSVGVEVPELLLLHKDEVLGEP